MFGKYLELRKIRERFVHWLRETCGASGAEGHPLLRLFEAMRRDVFVIQLAARIRSPLSCRDVFVVRLYYVLS